MVAFFFTTRQLLKIVQMSVWSNKFVWNSRAICSANVLNGNVRKLDSVCFTDSARNFQMVIDSSSKAVDKCAAPFGNTLIGTQEAEILQNDI